MNVAFFTLSPTSGMYGSLINEFIKNGHCVTVITPSPDNKSRLELKGNIHILYFKSLPLFNVGIIRKGIAHLLLPIMSLLGVKKFLSKSQFDLILLTTPPISLYKPIVYLKKKNPNSFVYLILRDIHPEGAKFIGLDKIVPLYAYFRNIEKKLYNISNMIGCMSPAGINFIAARNSSSIAAKLCLLPNWEEPIPYKKPNEAILRKYGLSGKFIFIYGGNMGIAQNLELILSLAEKKKTFLDLLFLFIGQGTEKIKLQNLAHEKGLNNVRFLDQLPREDYNEVMKACNVGIISLHPAAVIPNIPSKTLGYFSAKLPIFAAIDPITDYGTFIIDNSRGGYWSLATDIDKLSENIDKFYFDREKTRQLGESGYRYFIENYTTDRAYRQIMAGYKNE